MMKCGCSLWWHEAQGIWMWNKAAEAQIWNDKSLKQSLMDCNECKHKMICLIDPSCDQIFESK